MHYYNQPGVHNLNFIPFAFFGALMFGLFWLIVIIILVYFFKKSKHHRHHIHYGSLGSNSAENLLKERFVKGEINDEEYKRMKKTLSEDVEDKK
jgi:putative membrane protein